MIGHIAVEDTVSSPSVADLLAAWELGLPGTAAQRSVVLLGALLPQRSVESLLAMSVGERDVHLLHARRLLFGPELECVIACPACAVDLELSVAVEDLLAGAGGPEDPVSELDVAGWRVRLRSLDLQDLLDAAAAPDLAAVRATLLERCVVAATGPASEQDAGLPPEVEAALVDELERCNPTGALDFALRCPDCEHAWTAAFDVLGFLWAELDGWGERTLREVHLLASAYGWREPDILALSGWRRACYMQLSSRG